MHPFSRDAIDLGITFLRVDAHSQVGKDSAFPETDLTELFTERRVCVRLYLLKVTSKPLTKCRMSPISGAGGMTKYVARMI